MLNQSSKRSIGSKRIVNDFYDKQQLELYDNTDVLGIDKNIYVNCRVEDNQFTNGILRTSNNGEGQQNEEANQGQKEERDQVEEFNKQYLKKKGKLP